jgi:multidrug resistance efflux pump
MSEVETEAKRETVGDNPAAGRAPDPVARTAPRWRLRVFPLLITLVTIALATGLGLAMWNAYMGAPWTRDGTVRAYVVTMAPEVSGRIVELPVADNQFVHKGDLLMVIDPTNFKIAVSLAEAAVQQAQANAQNAERESKRRQALTTLAVTVEEKQTFETTALATSSISAGRRQSEPGASEPRAHADPLPGQWLGHEPAGAARRLRQCRTKRNLSRRRRLILDRRLF